MYTTSCGARLLTHSTADRLARRRRIGAMDGQVTGRIDGRLDGQDRHRCQCRQADDGVTVPGAGLDVMGAMDR